MQKIKFFFLVPLLFSGALAFSKERSSQKCEAALAKVQQAPIQTRFGADPLRVEAAESIVKGLKGRGIEMNVDAVEALFSSPPKPEMGQLAFPCFQLTKTLKMAPPKIAEALALELQNAHGPLIEKVEAAGGYLNFHIHFPAYLSWLSKAQTSGQYFASRLAPDQREKISLEFSQPNTHKALHVGHMRNMFLGESVARLLEYAGHHVVRSTYPGDMGTHVAKVLWYIGKYRQNEIPKTPSAEWLGKMYAEADQFIKDKGDDGETKSGFDGMLKKLESGEGPEFQFYRNTREWSLDQMKAVYAWLNIHFDKWYFESECDRPSRQLIEAKLKEGLLVRSDGAVGLDLNGEGLGFVLMLKKDGSGLYLTKDLELLRQKFSDPDVTRSVVVVDARQKLHFQQVFRSAEILGFPKAHNSMHLSYETVNDAEGRAFSSRALNGGLGLWQLKETLDQQPNPKMAMNNLRWGFLRVAPNDPIRFDMNQWLALNGNSAGDLVQLARRLKESSNAQSEIGPLSDLDKQVVALLSAFNGAVAKAVQDLDPSQISRYLMDLQGLLQKWEREPTPNKAAISASSFAVITHGLKILGID